MKDKDPQTIEMLLQDYGDSSLRKIVRQTQRLSLADKLLKECLPKNLHAYCQVAQLSATALSIQVDSAAWLTHLRYLKPQLLTQLKKVPQYAYLKDLQFFIKPLEKPQKPSPPPTPQSLSQETKKLLLQTAETINNPLLKKALLKLTSINPWPPS